MTFGKGIRHDVKPARAWDTEGRFGVCRRCGRVMKLPFGGGGVWLDGDGHMNCTEAGGNDDR